MAEHLRQYFFYSGPDNPHLVDGDDPTQPECVYAGCPRRAAPNDEACLYHLKADVARGRPKRYGEARW